MRPTFETLRDGDNLVALPWLRHRVPEAGDVDLDELLGVAEYMVPVRSVDFAVDPGHEEEVEAVIDWADADAETLRRAWMLAVHRCGAREVRRGTVELLATALHRAEERVTPNDPGTGASSAHAGCAPAQHVNARTRRHVSTGDVLQCWG